MSSSCSRMQSIKSTCWTVFSPPPIDIYQNCLKKRVVALYPGEHAVQNVGLVHSGMGGFRLRQFNLNAEKTVLTTTGAKTLEDARALFMSNSDKRIDTLLANADSVAYMISQAGRALDPGA